MAIHAHYERQDGRGPPACNPVLLVRLLPDGYCGGVTGFYLFFFAIVAYSPGGGLINMISESPARRRLGQPDFSDAQRLMSMPWPVGKERTAVLWSHRAVSMDSF